MPIYEYRCSGCKNNFTELGRLTGKNTQIDCPKCGFHDISFLSSFSVSGVNIFKDSVCLPSSSQFT